MITTALGQPHGYFLNDIHPQASLHGPITRFQSSVIFHRSKNVPFQDLSEESKYLPIYPVLPLRILTRMASQHGQRSYQVIKSLEYLPWYGTRLDGSGN